MSEGFAVIYCSSGLALNFNFYEYLSMRYPLVLAALMLTATQVFADVGSIDPQKAMTTVEQGKKVGTTLEQQFNARKAELDREEQAIKKLQETYQAQGSKWSDAEKKKREDEFRTRVQEFQKKLQASQEEIMKKEQELAQPIIERMKVVIEEIAKKKKLEIVINQQLGVAYMKEGTKVVDITDDVIKAYNAKHK